MADDKGGGGSSWEWGILEIIIGILLIVGVADHLFGNKTLLSGQPTNSSQTTTATQPAEIADTCGLTIVRPHANEKMLNTISLAGSAGECDWPTTPTVALYAQVVDSKGKPVSGYLTIPPTRAYDTGAYFESTIALTAKPAAGTGYLILVPAVQPAGRQHSVSTRIPLQF